MNCKKYLYWYMKVLRLQLQKGGEFAPSDHGESSVIYKRLDVASFLNEDMGITLFQKKKTRIKHSHEVFFSFQKGWWKYMIGSNFLFYYSFQWEATHFLANWKNNTLVNDYMVVQKNQPTWRVAKEKK